MTCRTRMMGLKFTARSMTEICMSTFRAPACLLGPSGHLDKRALWGTRRTARGARQIQRELGNRGDHKNLSLVMMAEMNLTARQERSLSKSTKKTPNPGHTLNTTRPRGSTLDSVNILSRNSCTAKSRCECGGSSVNRFRHSRATLTRQVTIPRGGGAGAEGGASETIQGFALHPHPQVPILSTIILSTTELGVGCHPVHTPTCTPSTDTHLSMPTITTANSPMGHTLTTLERTATPPLHMGSHTMLLTLMHTLRMHIPDPDLPPQLPRGGAKCSQADLVRLRLVARGVACRRQRKQSCTRRCSQN
mmetsp:Transcript_33378/g.66186  ORF Transcript_33378/g.66186 Transcript_33378/m.66186 type:complete len:306 (+) Transcript_33378:102-1019(+)